MNLKQHLEKVEEFWEYVGSVGREYFEEDIKSEFEFYLKNSECGFSVLKLTDDEYGLLEDEFWALVSLVGRDKEGCFDPDEELHKYITDTLLTLEWEYE